MNKEYIEREAVVQDIIKAQESLESDIDKEWTKNKPCFKGLAWANRIILETPAADVEPVQHGEWRLETDIEQPHPMFKLVVCSNCNSKANYTYPYCPYCRATMDGDSIRRCMKSYKH